MKSLNFSMFDENINTLGMLVDFAGTINYMPLEAFGSFITRGVDL